MNQLADIFYNLKRETNSLTINPLLNSFEQGELRLLDEKALEDRFILEKKNNILKLIKDIGIDFNPKLKSAYDEYSEGLTYLLLCNRFKKVDRIPEGKSKTPDFKIEFEIIENDIPVKYEMYAELKSMAFANGNLNYKNTIENGVESQINIENQINSGKKIGFGENVVQPLYKDNNNYDPTSIKYSIETLIDKIEQNIKEGQYKLGETVLIIDLKQITLPTFYIEGSVPIFMEKTCNSLVSGVQWNVALGKNGYLVFKEIEFEGADNVEGELLKDGVLLNRDFIKAIVFIDYRLGNNKPKLTGFYKQNNLTKSVEYFLAKLCDFTNDEKNTSGWRINNK